MNFTRQLIFIILSFSINAVLFAGGIKGKITDTNGTAIPYATIYVEESGTGTTSNVEGNYVYRVSAGTYNIIFQSIGYETVVKRVKIDNGFSTVNVSLKEQTYELAQVEVTSVEEILPIRLCGRQLPRRNFIPISLMAIRPMCTSKVLED